MDTASCCLSLQKDQLDAPAKLPSHPCGEDLGDDVAMVRSPQSPGMLWGTTCVNRI